LDRYWWAKMIKRKRKIEERKVSTVVEQYCFDMLDVLGLKIFHEAWMSFMDAKC
jgi:hypothetical protein